MIFYSFISRWTFGLFPVFYYDEQSYYEYSHSSLLGIYFAFWGVNIQEQDCWVICTVYANFIGNCQTTNCQISSVVEFQFYPILPFVIVNHFTFIHCGLYLVCNGRYFVVLICTCLINNVKHLFICLFVICVSSVVKCLLKFFFFQC